MIKECIDVFILKAEEKGIIVRAVNRTDTEFGLLLYTDINRLKQILINLISNAIKYT